MTKNLLIVVGECPPKPVPPSEFGKGRFAAVLCRHSKIREEDYMARTIRLNLFPFPVAVWSTMAAQVAAERLLGTVETLKASRMAEDATMVLCGTRVCAAFQAINLVPACAPFLTVWQTDRLTVAVFPHPSGRNHWWNSKENCERAGELFAKLFNDTLQPDDKDAR